MKATAIVIEFTALAFSLEALVKLDVRPEWIAGLPGRENPYAIHAAALLGAPVYAGNPASLPIRRQTT